jgi:hypothetical protein
LWWLIGFSKSVTVSLALLFEIDIRLIHLNGWSICLNLCVLLQHCSHSLPKVTRVHVVYQLVGALQMCVTMTPSLHVATTGTNSILEMVELNRFPHDDHLAFTLEDEFHE